MSTSGFIPVKTSAPLVHSVFVHKRLQGLWEQELHTCLLVHQNQWIDMEENSMAIELNCCQNNCHWLGNHTTVKLMAGVGVLRFVVTALSKRVSHSSVLREGYKSMGITHVTWHTCVSALSPKSWAKTPQRAIDTCWKIQGCGFSFYLRAAAQASWWFLLGVRLAKMCDVFHSSFMETRRACMGNPRLSVVQPLIKLHFAQAKSTYFQQLCHVCAGRRNKSETSISGWGDIPGSADRLSDFIAF